MTSRQTIVHAAYNTPSLSVERASGVHSPDQTQCNARQHPWIFYTHVCARVCVCVYVHLVCSDARRNSLLSKYQHNPSSEDYCLIFTPPPRPHTQKSSEKQAHAAGDTTKVPKCIDTCIEHIISTVTSAHTQTNYTAASNLMTFKGSIYEVLCKAP